MKIIARIYNDYDSKFGVPRQSGIIENESIIVFEPEYKVNEALRGLEEYNYIWLIWQFSEIDENKAWSPTVRPPGLGGNIRKGVFATRSPFRPNPIGLSSVKLCSIINTEDKGTVLKVTGADLINGTPIYDIKPYIHYIDCHDDATDGFAFTQKSGLLTVNIDDKFKELIPENKIEIIKEILAQDPRPRYIDDGNREYGMSYAGLNIRFTVNDNILNVTDIYKNIPED
jgi:tRNA-Thr(GGU) m(6)t(6)A37 methyltransferase TsaA